jgi:hypothetical protein
MSERTLLAGLLVLAGTLALLFYTELAPAPLRALLNREHPAAAAQAPKAPQPQPHAVRSRFNRSSGDVAASRIPDSDLPVQEIVMVAPRIPTPVDLPRNLPRQDVIGAFGPPDVSATWADNSQLNEKLIYRDRHSGIEIYLRNGVVVSARVID